MEKDLTKKRCLSDNRRYADLINGFIFQGQQVLQETDLTEMDSQTVTAKNPRLNTNRKTYPKYHDFIRKAALGVNFAVINLEDQEEVHYLMPLRAMGYDTAEYERQTTLEKKKVRTRTNISSAEFLSGFRKDSRLHPCITLVLFFGEEWDGSRDLHGILDFTDIPSELKKYINNYPIHLLEVRKLENTEVFQTDLRQIFDFIRYSKDKEKLKKLVTANPDYQELEEDAYDMAALYSQATELISIKKYHGKDGKVNMCEALTALIEDGRAEGEIIGKAKGKIIGKATGVESIIKNFHVDLETACNIIGITPEEYYKSKNEISR